MFSRLLKNIIFQILVSITLVLYAAYRLGGSDNAPLYIRDLINIVQLCLVILVFYTLVFLITSRNHDTPAKSHKRSIVIMLIAIIGALLVFAGLGLLALSSI